MDISEREHYKRRGLSDDDIDMLAVCLHHCTGCINNGNCNIRLMESDNNDRDENRDDQNIFKG